MNGPTRASAAGPARTPAPIPAAALEPPAPDPVPGLIAAWLAAYESENTRRAYARDVTGWVRWLRSLDLDPLAVRRVHVDAYARTELADLAASTRARKLAALSAFYHYAAGEELVDRNPLDHVRRPRVDAHGTATRGLSHDEARNLLTISRHRLRPGQHAAIALLLLCGLRRSEVLAADVADLGHDRGHRTLTYRAKGGANRTIPLPPAVVEAVDRAVGDRDAGPIVATSTGRRVDGSTLFRLVRRAALLAGIPDPDTVTPHSLRHAFATLALDAGAGLHEVQDALGHADPRMTRRYDRARGSLDRHPGYRLGSLAPD